MDEKKLRHDHATGTLRYASGLAGDALLPKDTGLSLSRVARKGEWKGAPVARVVVEFVDDAAAARNADPMAFLGLISAGPGGEVESSAKFDARSDFGVEKS